MKTKRYCIKNTKTEKHYILYIYKKNKTSYVTVQTYINPKK